MTTASSIAAATVETWWPEILDFLELRISNARTEGYNRTIKTIKGVSVNRPSEPGRAEAA